MEGATQEGNQGRGNQLSSEEKSQGKEEVSADPLGEVTNMLQCCGPVDELPRREATGELLGWRGEACLHLSLAQTLFPLGVLSSCWDAAWKPLLPSPCLACPSGEAADSSPGHAGESNDLQRLQA